MVILSIQMSRMSEIDQCELTVSDLARMDCLSAATSTWTVFEFVLPSVSGRDSILNQSKDFTDFGHRLWGKQPDDCSADKNNL